MIRINNFKIREDLTEAEVINKCKIKYNLKEDTINSINIVKKSIDARNKEDIYYIYSLDVDIKTQKSYLECKRIKSDKNVIAIASKELPVLNITNDFEKPPVIIGAGPSGLFAALTFVDNGIKPIIIEQGKTASKRQEDVNAFLEKGTIDPLSNVQFGEGGAGTFSDGKLTTGINSVYSKKVLEYFVQFGAPKQILYLAKPHIGTDNLVVILKNMRKYIESKGGSFLFNEKVTDFEIVDNKITAVYCSKKIETNNVILAIGHSSKDTFRTLFSKGVNMEPKNFSIGVRIEHKQDMINKSQYGTSSKLNLPTAEYKLSCHLPNGRSCYSFCMCPGGVVIPSSSDENTVVTNGMSYFKRDLENANSALLVNVTPNDFGSTHPLAGLDFQHNLEKKAFELGGSNYFAPIQLVGDFLENKKSEKIGSITPTYAPGVTFANLHDILPEYISESLKLAIVEFDKKLKGFNSSDAILTGLETRSSSPVTIIRNEKMLSNISGIYPCGEGSGYAGGITSAAVDGIRCASMCATN